MSRQPKDQQLGIELHIGKWHVAITAVGIYGIVGSIVLAVIFCLLFFH